MNDSELMIGAVALITSLFIALFGMIFHLMRRVIKLEQTINDLESQLQSGGHDVAGLCSAALVVDRRLAHQEELLKDLQNTVNLGLSKTMPTPEIENEDELEPDVEGYDKAIQLIKRGTDLETLVKRCGVTRDEAMLLLRLHGNR